MKKSIFTRMFSALGPGFVTGAADDDPTNIATFSQTGAMFGYAQSWTQLFSYPFMVVIQEMCGRIGLVTGMGLSAIVRRYYSSRVLFVAVALLFIANTVNIGADLGAMAASVQLIFPVQFWSALVAFSVFTVALEVFVPYPAYARILRYFTLALFAYVFTALIVTHDWASALRATVFPHIEWSKDYILNIAAIMGTTLSPYLFFWQADEEVEEEIEHHKLRSMGKGIPHVANRDISRMRIDTALGMFFSNVISLFMIFTVAATLYVSGIHSVATAQDAAAALRPLAGDLAALIFTLGIIGTALIAVPVLAGSAAYALAEAVGWRASLGVRFGQARGFYVVIVVATLLGLLINALGVPAMLMLYWSSVLNGVLAPPLMALILVIGSSRRIMGRHTNPFITNLAGWFITLVMAGIAITLLASLVF